MADEVEDQETAEGQENPQQNNDKISKKHEQIMKVIVTVLGDADRLKPVRQLEMDATARVVAELFKEENEANEVKAKEGLKELLKKYLEFQKAVSAKQKELNELTLKQKKDFNEAANKWLGFIDQKTINSKEYAEALKSAFQSEDDKDDPIDVNIVS